MLLRDALGAGVAGAAFLLAAGVTAATAQDRPPLMPARDVAVTYQVQPEGAPQPQLVRVFFKGGGGLMRVDGPPAPPGSNLPGGIQGDMVMDRDAKIMTVVLNTPRIFMEIPERDTIRSPFVLDESMQFTRSGTGSVAGQGCTNWSITAGQGNATACVTADGVVLSEQGVDGQGNKGRLVATEIHYGALPPDLFKPPAGFQRVSHPANMGQGLGGPAGAPGGAPGGGPLLGPQDGVPGGQ